MQTHIYVASRDQRIAGVADRPGLCDAMDGIRFFREFSRAEIEALSGYVERYTIPAGEALLIEGERAPGLYFLLSGRVRLYKRDDKDVQKPLAVVRPGSVLGEVSMIDRQPVSATAIAIEPVDIVLLPADKLDRLCRQRQGLAIRLIWALARELSARLRKTSGSLITHL